MLGVEHHRILTTMNNLASTYMNLGRWKEAEDLEMQVIKISKKGLGMEYLDKLTAMNNLVLTYTNQRQWNEAGELGM